MQICKHRLRKTHVLKFNLHISQKMHVSGKRSGWCTVKACMDSAGQYKHSFLYCRVLTFWPGTKQGTKTGQPPRLS